MNVTYSGISSLVPMAGCCLIVRYDSVFVELSSGRSPLPLSPADHDREC